MLVFYPKSFKHEKIVASIKKSNFEFKLMQYEKFIKDKYHLNFKSNYDKIFNWSIKHKENFGTVFGISVKLKGLKGKNKIKNSKFFIKIYF